MKVKHSHKLNKLNLKRNLLSLYIGDSIPIFTVYTNGSGKQRQMMSEWVWGSNEGTRTFKEEEKRLRLRG